MTTDHWGYEKEQQPDIVEVIRCKYCDHWYNHYGKDQFPYKGQCELMELPTDDDFYCKGGERRAKWSNISKAE